MHLTLGILRQSQTVFYALSFFWLDGFAVPTPAQVTQTVRRFLARQTIHNQMSKTYSINRKWKILLGGLSILLITFASVFIPIYLSGESWLFLGLALVMFALSTLLIFGAFSTKIVVSSNGITSFAFWKSNIINWDNIEAIEINPVNLLIFAKLRNPPNEMFAISPFATNDQIDNLLRELVNYLPKEVFQKELLDVIGGNFSKNE